MPATSTFTPFKSTFMVSAPGWAVVKWFIASWFHATVTGMSMVWPACISIGLLRSV